MVYTYSVLGIICFWFFLNERGRVKIVIAYQITQRGEQRAREKFIKRQENNIAT